MQNSPEYPLPDRASVIRWYVNLIENLSLSSIWGQEDGFPEVERILRHTVALLYDGARSPNGCPWPRCPDGLCSPICMIGFSSAEAGEEFFESEGHVCPGKSLK